MEMAQRPRLSFVSSWQNHPQAFSTESALRVCPNATEIKVNKFPTMFGHFPSRQQQQEQQRQQQQDQEAYSGHMDWLAMI